MINFKKLKPIICFCIIIFTVSLNSSGLAIKDSRIPSEITPYDFNDILDVEITESYLGLTKHFSDVTKFTDIIKENYVGMSDLELAKSIRSLLGESEDVIEQMPDEVVMASLAYEEVFVQESYLKTGINGKAELISTQELETELSAIQQTNPDPFSIPESDVQALNALTNKEGTYPFPNGYMKITTRASRIAKHANDETWLVSGEALWLKEPFWTLTDMITIGSTALYDSDYASLDYGSKSSFRSCILQNDYGYINHNYHRTTYNTIIPEYTSGAGYSIKSSLVNQLCSDQTWRHPPSYHTCREDHSHRYYAQYCVNTTGNFNVLVGYGHRVLAIGGVSASINSSGLDIGISFNTGTEEYISQPLLVKPSDYN